MIKLQRPQPPEELTEEVKKELLEKYESNGASVWRQPYLIKKLLEMSNSKCAYCECRVNEESKYMEVDHFYPKNKYGHRVIEWGNLLPSCKRCNGSSKRQHDPGEEPIIDPSLNDQDKLVIKRKRIGDQLAQDMADLYEEIRYRIKQLPDDQNFSKKVSRKVTAFLRQAIPQSEYAATSVTILLNDANFMKIKRIMQNEGIWTSEHENLYKSAEQIQLELK